MGHLQGSPSGGGGLTSLGLDIGTTTLKIVLLDSDNEVINKVYRFHHGKPLETLKEEAASLGVKEPVSIGVTGAHAKRYLSQGQGTEMDYVKSVLAAVLARFPRARNIIDIGGSSLSLIKLNQEGNFQNYSTNSLCAAGTGSFLDEQAGRLGLTYDSLKEFPFDDNPPSVATRCAVFAKSDITHRQQEGYSKAAMWSGLCKGMAQTLLQTLLKGLPLKGLTVIIGGVALNAHVVRWLKSWYGEMVQTYPDAHLAAAEGAAMLAAGHQLESQLALSGLTDDESHHRQEELQRPLVLTKSKYPDFTVAEEYLDRLGNEVRVSYWPALEGDRSLPVYLGIDIGSTSTKIVVMDEAEEILADLYRKTGGDPIGATKALFAALNDLCSARGTRLEVKGCGTTGSGRKLVGTVVGADAIINEISAHVTGALRTDPSIDTIFEIGGQDSKYMHTRAGHIHDSNMNYACAAGTGSFVEEQVKKLGFPLNEVGKVVQGISPPRTSDRCTVFMEQDVNKLMRQGYSRAECMAAVMYSVCCNYLNKVVGKRYVSKDKIFFQGATARNPGLVAAFENLLNVEVVVSPYCHVMGAYGVAILTRRAMEQVEKPSRFKGLELASRRIEVSYQNCDVCRDHCKISYAHIEGEKEVPSWGYMCGREPEDTGKKSNQQFLAFKKREKLFFAPGGAPRVGKGAPVIGLPRGLTTHTFYPLWRRFFAELGLKTILSPASSPAIIQQGIKLAAADFCFPVKLCLGHISSLTAKEKVDFIFTPFMISSEPNPLTSNSYFCPYVQGMTAVARSALELNELSSERFLAPVIDFRWPRKRMVDQLSAVLSKRLRRSRKELEQAWTKALEAQRAFTDACLQQGRRLLDELEERDEVGIVCVGRPYNTIDLGANLALPRKIAELGYRVIPIDFIPPLDDDIEPYANMFWTHGQRILNAIRWVKKNQRLFAVYFTNFNCGPDSFLINFAEHEMGDKPFLILEVDEHGADTGYITRVEAFLDVVRAWKPKYEATELYIPPATNIEFKRRKIWIPPMHPIASRLFAAAFRGFGYSCEALPGESQEDLARGRALTRGSECLPLAVTIGVFLRKLDQLNADPREHAFFMPTADGPCRFGQYALLQRIILNRSGYHQVPILSPSSQNSYQGLEEGLRRNLFKSLVVGDTLTKSACRVRPYELNPGQTNKVLEEQLQNMEAAFSEKQELIPALARAVDQLAAIPTGGPPKPLIGIVGEIYVRCSSFCNEGLIDSIERHGGEAWLTPAVEWILYTTAMEKWEGKQRGDGLWPRTCSALKNYLMTRSEHELVRPAKKLLADRPEPSVSQVMEEGAKYVPVNFGGEAILTLGRAAIFARQGVAAVVNCAPFSCMPGAISAAILPQLEQTAGIPIISIFYDGQGGLNYRLKFFIDNHRGRKA